MKKTPNEYEMLLRAKKEHYAIGAFNFSSLEIMRAIVDAATETRSPVILALSEGGLRYVEPRYIKYVADAVADMTDVPIVMHLDHGKTFDIVCEVVDLGFHSVMIDGSSLSYEENVAITKKVVNYAHARGVVVEGELGVLAGVEDDISSDVHKYTDPEQAVDFVKKTGVDSLAIAIGTSHGAYKFEGEPKLKIDILQQINSLLPDTPLVLHGASSVPQEYVEIINQYGGDVKGARGVPAELIAEACANGISKVNCDTDLRLVFTATVRKFLAENPTVFDPRKYLQASKDNMRDFVKDKITNVLHSANKA